jgi:hypothetical protein
MSMQLKAAQPYNLSQTPPPFIPKPCGSIEKKILDHVVVLYVRAADQNCEVIQ